MMSTILRIDASMRRDGSTTRALTDQITTRLGGEVIVRDLADGIALIDEAWIDANFTPDDARSAAQREALAVSDRLVEELRAADTLVIGVPMYNFGIPAALKAWIDQVSRARVTFRYTPDGPVGLLDGKRAILVVASGGTGIEGEIDFATPYLRHALGFIGITDVTVIAAGRQMAEPHARAAAEAAIARLTV